MHYERKIYENHLIKLIPIYIYIYILFIYLFIYLLIYLFYTKQCYFKVCKTLSSAEV